MIKRRHGGFTVWYTAIAMVALTGVCSLAVDYGRAQVVKVQLRRAVDAAARYGASGLQVDAATAVSRAKTSAGENNADNSPVTVTTKTGHWDIDARKFIENGSPMDAIEVSSTRDVPLLLGKLLGQNACTVNASAVGARNVAEPNFVGLNGISAKNNASMGYKSSSGSPGGANQSDAYLMGSNAAITFSNNLSINGGVVLGPSGTFSGTTPMPMYSSTALSYAATESPTVFNSGNLTVSGTVHISGGGTVCYTNVNFSNNSTLIFDQPTTVYVTGSINAAQGSTIQAASNVPKDLKIRMTGGASSVFGGSNANNFVVTALVYAPATDFSSKNNATLYGSMIFRTISVQNNLYADYDTDSGSVLSGQGLVTGSSVSIVK